MTALLIFILGFGSFVGIYNYVDQGTLTPSLDLTVMQWMVSHRVPFVTSVMEIITNVLSPISFAVAVLLVVGIWIWRTKERWRPSLLLLAMGMAFILGAVIKAGVERIRPPVEHMIAPFELDFAFPSGHTIGIATFTLVLGYLIYSRRRTVQVLVSWIGISITATALVAFSRMYLGYHWLTDTVAATALSLIILAAIILIDMLHKQSVDEPTEVASDNVQ